MARPTRNARQGRQQKTETRNPVTRVQDDIVLSSAMRIDDTKVTSLGDGQRKSSHESDWPNNLKFKELTEERLMHLIEHCHPILISTLDNVQNDLENACHDLWIAMRNAWPSIKQNPEAFAAWSARNLAIRINESKSRTRLTSNVLTLEQPHLDYESMPREVNAKIDATAILLRLNDADRDLIKMKYFEKLKNEEIAERIGVTPNYAGVLVNRLLKRIRDRMGIVVTDQD